MRLIWGRLLDEECSGSGNGCEDGEVEGESANCKVTLSTGAQNFESKSHFTPNEAGCRNLAANPGPH